MEIVERSSDAVRVYYFDPETEGRVLGNPPDVIRVIAGSSHKAAAVLLFGKDIVTSTVPGLSHDEMKQHAGIMAQDFMGWEDDPNNCVLRCNMSERCLSLDLWWDSYFVDGFPYDQLMLEALEVQMVNHPKLRKLPEGFVFQIAIHDGDGVPVFNFRDGELSVTEDYGHSYELPDWATSKPRDVVEVPRMHFQSSHRVNTDLK